MKWCLPFLLLLTIAGCPSVKVDPGPSPPPTPKPAPPSGLIARCEAERSRRYADSLTAVAEAARNGEYRLPRDLSADLLKRFRNDREAVFGPIGERIDAIPAGDFEAIAELLDQFAAEYRSFSQ